MVESDLAKTGLAGLLATAYYTTNFVFLNNKTVLHMSI